MIVRNLVNDIMRVYPGYSKGDRLVETMQLLVRGEELTSLEKANLMNFAAAADYTVRYERDFVLFFDKNGVRIEGAVAETLRWNLAHTHGWSQDKGKKRLTTLGKIHEELLQMGLTESVADDLVEPMLVAYDSRKIKYLDEKRANDLLDGEWGLWQSAKMVFIRMKNGKRPHEVIEWCLEKSFLRKAIPYASW